MSTRDIRIVRPARTLTGEVGLPPDKSIAHRAAIFASIGKGTSRLVRYPTSEDPQSTLSCMRALGVQMYEEDDGIIVVEGAGVDGLREASGVLDCGNSGTTMRLLAGLLAGRTFRSTLTGDASLSARPMERIAQPLRAMGAEVSLTAGRAPIVVGGAAVQGITYRLPVASAQVKSCVLLAGLSAEGVTTVVEPTATRDHTERMLGLDVIEMGGERHISIEPGLKIPSRIWSVPNDFSAAAFFLVAGSIVPDAALFLPAVGLNPSRTALIDVLRAMGADIRVENERRRGGEPIADIRVFAAGLTGVSVGGSVVANLIDELPILAVAAACAEGVTHIRDAGELRVKETDRIAAMATNLRAFGVELEELEDGLVIQGGARIKGAEVESFHDHRIAMASAVAALKANGRSTIHGASVASVSFPGFWEELENIRL